MSPETVKQIKQALEPLAEVAQQGAEFSWEVLVRQVIISGVLNLALALLLLAAMVLLARLGVKAFRAAVRANEQDEDGMGFVWGLGGCVAAEVPLFAFFLGTFSNGAGKLLNPGFYALQEVAKMVGVS